MQPRCCLEFLKYIILITNTLMSLDKKSVINCLVVSYLISGENNATHGMSPSR